MTTPAADPPHSPPAAGVVVDRLLGDYTCGIPGPLFVVTGGIHGNEPEGAHAARRVLAALRARAPRIHGKFVAFAGNRAALQRGTRYIDRDLNRCWTELQIHDLLRQPPHQDSSEDREQRELLALLDACQKDASCERLVFVDLHSFSAPGPPFAIMADTLHNRRVAFALPVPVIFGLEETIDGTLLEYLSEKGHVSFAVEGGRQHEPSTVDHHEAVIWIALLAAGCLEEEDVPDLARFRERLARRTAGCPRAVEVRYRHGIESGDAFEMKPGYENFTKVRRGEVLASSRGREVHSPEGGAILMPLYQKQGSDGFFLGRRISPFWLFVSSALRHLGVDRMLRWLPGVEPHPRRPHALRVDSRVARFFATEVFHLLGFRRRASEDGKLVFVRRRQQASF